MRILQCLFRRMPRLLLVLLGVSMMTFTLSHVIPGDPARMLAGQKASPETLDKIRTELGLDLPLPLQYGRYVSGLLHGDMGRSIRTQQPVAEELMKYFPATLELTLASMVITLAGGIFLGVMAALHRNGWVDHVCRLFSLAGVSLPLFWSGLLVLIVFYQWLQWFPASGRLDSFLSPPPRVTGLYLIDGLLAGDGPAVFSALEHLVLPACCLAYVQLALIARQVRSSMIQVLALDYIRTARAFGLPEVKVVYRYALKNALLPTVTVTGLVFGELLGGAIITETIFSWPGMGKYVVDSAAFLDFPAIMGFTLVVAMGYVAINMAVDLLYQTLDPRIREVD